MCGNARSLCWVPNRTASDFVGFRQRPLYKWRAVEGIPLTFAPWLCLHFSLTNVLPLSLNCPNANPYLILGSFLACLQIRWKRTHWVTLSQSCLRLKMIGKSFYRKRVKSSFEQFITTQMRVGSTNGWIISQNTEILKFFFRQSREIFGICDVIKWLRLRWMCP